MRGSAIKRLVYGAECLFVQDLAGQTPDVNLREQGLGISIMILQEDEGTAYDIEDAGVKSDEETDDAWTIKSKNC